MHYYTGSHWYIKRMETTILSRKVELRRKEDWQIIQQVFSGKRIQLSTEETSEVDIIPSIADSWDSAYTHNIATSHRSQNVEIIVT